MYVPQRQRVLVKQLGEFDRMHAIRSIRLSADDLAASPGRFVGYLRSSAAAKLVARRVLDSPGAALW